MASPSSSLSLSNPIHFFPGPESTSSKQMVQLMKSATITSSSSEPGLVQSVPSTCSPLVDTGSKDLAAPLFEQSTHLNPPPEFSHGHAVLSNEDPLKDATSLTQAQTQMQMQMQSLPRTGFSIEQTIANKIPHLESRPSIDGGSMDQKSFLGPREIIGADDSESKPCFSDPPAMHTLLGPSDGTEMQSVKLLKDKDNAPRPSFAPFLETNNDSHISHESHLANYSTVAGRSIPKKRLGSATQRLKDESSTYIAHKKQIPTRFSSVVANHFKCNPLMPKEPGKLELCDSQPISAKVQEDTEQKISNDVPSSFRPATAENSCHAASFEPINNVNFALQQRMTNALETSKPTEGPPVPSSQPLSQASSSKVPKDVPSLGEAQEQDRDLSGEAGSYIKDPDTSISDLSPATASDIKCKAVVPTAVSPALACHVREPTPHSSALLPDANLSTKMAEQRCTMVDKVSERGRGASSFVKSNVTMAVAAPPESLGRDRPCKCPIGAASVSQNLIVDSSPLSKGCELAKSIFPTDLTSSISELVKRAQRVQPDPENENDVLRNGLSDAYLDTAGFVQSYMTRLEQESIEPVTEHPELASRLHGLDADGISSQYILPDGFSASPIEYGANELVPHTFNWITSEPVRVTTSSGKVQCPLFDTHLQAHYDCFLNRKAAAGVIEPRDFEGMSNVYDLNEYAVEGVNIAPSSTPFVGKQAILELTSVEEKKVDALLCSVPYEYGNLSENEGVRSATSSSASNRANEPFSLEPPSELNAEQPVEQLRKRIAGALARGTFSPNISRDRLAKASASVHKCITRSRHSNLPFVLKTQTLQQKIGETLISSLNPAEISFPLINTSPYWPKVLAFGIDPRLQRSLIATEYIEGVTLDIYMRHHEQSPPRTALVVKWIWDMLQILTQFRARKFVHYDLKPGNIMVCSSDKSLSVVDFGYGLYTDQPEFICPNKNVIRGTMAYMSSQMITNCMQIVESEILKTRSQSNVSFCLSAEDDQESAALTLMAAILGHSPWHPCVLGEQFLPIMGGFRKEAIELRSKWRDFLDFKLEGQVHSMRVLEGPLPVELQCALLDLYKARKPLASILKDVYNFSISHGYASLVTPSR